MTSNCKPSVNRLQKMVPEGGFEPPTRGFSINVQPPISAGLFVNQPQNGLFGINSLQTGCKPKWACEHTRVKGQPTSQPHVKARLCDSVLPERGANKGDNRMKFTASLRP